jgi:hypothetical protein
MNALRREREPVQVIIAKRYAARHVGRSELADISFHVETRKRIVRRKRTTCSRCEVLAMLARREQIG